MKLNKSLLSLATLATLAIPSFSYAAGVEILGDSYGTSIGLIHWDHTTSIRPSSDPSFNDPSYYKGPTRQFYIDPSDPSYTGPETDLRVIANVNTDSCTTSCNLHGFAWSDKIGWIALDGENEIEPNITNNTGPNAYNSDMYPKIHTSNAALTGVAWNEQTGWIMLSSDSDQPNPTGTVTQAPLQNASDWGAYLTSGEIHGNIWSEKLGWIKMYYEVSQGDTLEFGQTFGATTAWVPDVTPPDLLIVQDSYFAMGKNTGHVFPNPTLNPNTIQFTIAEDPETGIDDLATAVTVSLDNNPIFSDCFEPVVPASVVVDATGTITIPVVGNLQNLDTTSNGYCRYELGGDIVNGVGLTTTIPPNTYFMHVRAGDFDKDASLVVMPPTDRIADGGLSPNGIADLRAQIRDFAGNPIIDVSCPGSCFGRNVTADVDFDNETVFDMTQVSPPSGVYETPVKINSTWIQSDRTNEPMNVPSIDNEYSFQLASAAPTTSYVTASEQTVQYHFNIERVRYTISDDEVPAWHTNGTTGRIATCNDPGTCTLNNPGTIPGEVENGLVATGINFIPAIYTSNGVITTNGLQDSIDPSAEADFDFDLNNISSSEIAKSGVDQGSIAIDNIFIFHGDPTAALAETRLIYSKNPPDPDSHYGWTPPMPGPSNAQGGDHNLNVRDRTRYEIYDGDLNTGNTMQHNQTPFYAFYAHPISKQFLFWNDVVPATQLHYVDKCLDANHLDSDGTYRLSGLYQVPEPNEERRLDYTAPPYNKPFQWCDQGVLTDPIDPTDPLYGFLWHKPDPDAIEYNVIDRNEGGGTLDISLNATSNSSDPLNNPDIRNMQIALQPTGFLPGNLNVQFRIVQEIAYRFSGQPKDTIYAAPPIIDGIGLTNLGLEALGPVSGEKLVSGRKFEVLGSAGTRDLQEQIRRNVAELTTGMTSCSANTTIPDLENTPASCTRTLGSGTIAWFEGSKNQILELDGPQPQMLSPNGMTLIVTGGANVHIKDNLFYDAPGAGFGIILLAEPTEIGTSGDPALNPNGHGANLLIDPAPYTIAAVAYAEGSVMGYDGNYFYGNSGNGSSIGALANQLYWVGSIASRNTIGGAAAATPLLPNAIPSSYCYTGEQAQDCARRYDLDFLRRFTFQQTNSPVPLTDIIANNGTAAGGVTCAAGDCSCNAPSACEFNPSGFKATHNIMLLDLSNPNGGDVNVANSELAPVFIEPHPNSTNNPPPGFTVSEGFETIQDIR